MHTPTTLNINIAKYNINAEELRAKNKYNLLNDKDFNEKLNELQEAKFKKWQKYRDKTGFLPHDISKYHVGDQYFPAREKVKNPDYIKVRCKSFNLSDRKYDHETDELIKKSNTYVKNVIINSLSKRQRQLIDLLYYKLMPIDVVIEEMGFPNKKALNKEKHRALKTIKLKLLNDYNFILNEHSDYDFIKNEHSSTYLTYWVKLIQQRYVDTYDKVAN